MEHSERDEAKSYGNINNKDIGSTSKDMDAKAAASSPLHKLASFFTFEYMHGSEVSDSLIYAFHIISWGYPILLVTFLSVFYADMVGLDSNAPWCYLTRGVLSRVLIIYLPLLVCMVFTFICYILARKEVYRIEQEDILSFPIKPLYQPPAFATGMSRVYASMRVCGYAGVGADIFASLAQRRYIRCAYVEI